jgi:hypothetical protein
MELFADDQDRESKDAAEMTESRQSSASRRAAPRGRSVGKVQKKRRLGRKTSGARRGKKRAAAPAVPSQGRPAPASPRPEPPPIIPQPSLDSPEEEPSEPEEPRQEPPPPSASANSRDGDDLFEYVF